MDIPVLIVAVIAIALILTWVVRQGPPEGGVGPPPPGDDSWKGGGGP